MKSKEPTYKDYSFPFSILLAYLFLSVAGIVLLDICSMIFMTSNDDEGGFGVMILIYPAVIFVFYLIMRILCSLKRKKVYRGVGLYRTATLISIACLFIFVAMIVFMNLTNMRITFCNIGVLIFELSVPPILMWVLRKFTRRCRKCGLMNTYEKKHIEHENLGREHKFHTEEGYYIDENTYVPKTTVYDGLYEITRFTTTYKCAVCGDTYEETKRYETK
ncbi:MAG: hypothetical protein E7350_05495, partial [Clostridiales bacterium]|nr:hypothetical protein [Clostridiales bacterium]